MELTAVCLEVFLNIFCILPLYITCFPPINGRKTKA